MYEPGSTFKLQTAAMALDSGLVHIWNMFDASHDVYFGGFHISDFEGKHRWLYLPEVLAYSSNLGAAHIALTVGAARQRAWLRKMGVFARVPIQLPEAGMPLVQPKDRWQVLTTMTVGFGQGISISPLHLVRATSMLANGGTLITPTLAALPSDTAPTVGPRLMQRSTSDTLRRLMRLVVTSGYGKPADIPGFYVGGKTGTSEKVGHYGYRKHANVSAFISIFPMNAPRYAVYFMLDDPKGNKSTGFFSTAGAVSAPGAGRVIARIGPMLGLFPDLQDKAAIDASLTIPLQPAAPPDAQIRIVPPMTMAGERLPEPRAPLPAVYHPPTPPPAPPAPPSIRYRTDGRPAGGHLLATR
jgi:cell division protein FtsI (penicillin-binding protein 3)